MDSWRAYFLKHQRLAFALVALALLVKAIVPAGFMVMPTNGTIMVSVCSGQGPQMVALELNGGSDHSSDHGGQDSTAADHPCAFSGLSLAAAPGADPALLGAAIAFILSLAFLPVVSRPRRSPSRLRPPLRAPPVFG